MRCYRWDDGKDAEGILTVRRSDNRMLKHTVNNVSSLRDCVAMTASHTDITPRIFTCSTHNANALHTSMSRRDNILLTVCFSLRTADTLNLSKSRRDDTLLTVGFSLWLASLQVAALSVSEPAVSQHIDSRLTVSEHGDWTEYAFRPSMHDHTLVEYSRLCFISASAIK